MIDRAGQKIGNYQLIRLLGHGGFADVYLGEHIYLKTLAAIKVLHTQLANEDVEQFRNEAQTIAHLIHPHIIRVLDFAVDNHTPLLVMDYAPNGTLRQRHPKGEHLSLATVVSYVKQIASALQYAHDRKLIHRDVKPENMLLGQNDELLLSDFGIALVAENSRSQSTDDVVMGTMAYMAPEQIQGKTRLASDQYSLAVVVYEWLCGVKPFRGSYMEIVTQHLSSTPPPIRDYAIIHPAAERAITKALEKDPHMRFARVQDFADALEKAYLASLQPNPSLADTVYIDSSTPPPAVPAPDRPILSAGEHNTSAVKSRASRIVKHSLRAFLITTLISAVLLCGLGYGGFRIVSSMIASRSSASSGTTAAVIVSNDFLQAIEHQNYTQAYNDFNSPLKQQTSEKDFVQQGQRFDRCHGPVSQYTQESNPQLQNDTEQYSYTIVRPRLSHTYKLNLTLKKDSNGAWHISDYNSNQPDC